MVKGGWGEKPYSYIDLYNQGHNNNKTQILGDKMHTARLAFSEVWERFPGTLF